MELLIREACEGDIDGIVECLADDTVGGHGNTTDEAARPRYLAAFARIAASPNDRLYVAELEGEVVGTFQTTLITVMNLHGRPDMTIEAVHVRAKARGKGVGAAMMRFAIEEARRAGVRLVQLTSNAKRVDAHRFYERLGFVKSHVGFKMRFD
ncbi:GNAT family N-acetyltransferase [Mesorhizobium sp. BAC0120]|uniref:GNAT family N-acetyltransferase n=1 Tax=Mesorhizobium sp. BAC0120 TaxID=3090670 RepID=UPI00399A743C